MPIGNMNIDTEVQDIATRLTTAIEQAASDKMQIEADNFRAKVEIEVRKHVDKVIAPLTEGAITDTVKHIAQGMVDQFSVQQWRVKELINEALEPIRRDIMQLGRRIAALEAKGVTITNGQ